MANIDYPSWLPLPQRASKNMTIDTGFRVDQPSVGPMIIQPLTYDLKVQWSLTWIMTIQEERAFQLWLRDANYGLAGASKWFNMMVNLGGSGLMMQELAFTQFPTQSSLTHGTATWTGTVVANNLNNDDDDFAEIIIGLPPEWYSILDIVVNQTLPPYPYSIPLDLVVTGV